MTELLELIKNNPKTSATLLMSFVGLIYGIRRYSLAKKKSKIDFKEYKDKNKSFGLYLVDFYRIVKENNKLLIFHIRLTNHAISKNTYSAELELIYLTEDKVENSVKLTHQAELFKKIEHKDLTKLNTHIRLNEKEIASGWLIFELPKHLEKSRIKKYKISVSDTEKNSLEVESYIAKDLVYEDKKI